MLVKGSMCLKFKTVYSNFGRNKIIYRVCTIQLPETDAKTALSQLIYVFITQIRAISDAIMQLISCFTPIFNFRSGQDLSNSIPSSKIVIQKSTEKLEMAWSQMQSLWSSRNGLYEKNLDLRVCCSSF